MFTGIIETLGSVKSIAKRGAITSLAIKANGITEDTGIGDSIAVNGVCLTVVQKNAESLAFEIMPETLKSTNLGTLKVADKVNLERSLKVGARVSGHFVLGHVDCLGVIRKKTYTQGNLSFAITVPPAYIKYCLPKGSLAVDGISLTLASIRSTTVAVYIIPHTCKNTTLSFKGPSDKVNLEFDILAKRTI